MRGMCDDRDVRFDKWLDLAMNHIYVKTQGQK